MSGKCVVGENGQVITVLADTRSIGIGFKIFCDREPRVCFIRDRLGLHGNDTISKVHISCALRNNTAVILTVFPPCFSLVSSGRPSEEGQNL